jgi:Amt family ammonium transporter
MINSGDTAWILISSALVLLMTMPGVALFYGGLVRRKNVLSMIMMSFMVLCFISIQWILWGYSLAFGPDHYHLIGSFDWINLNQVGFEPNTDYAKTIPHILYMTFQMMFAVITPALISGALAERMKFSAYFAFILIWSTVVYAPIAHWVWGNGGWLRNMGVLDFAGGTVVHISSGVSALICALVLGKRRGFGKVPMRPHNLPLTLLGGALLWFGWFGFNAGSALAANQTAALAFITTNTASAAAGLAWMGIDWKMTGKPTLLGAMTGAIAGLVAITPAAGFVSPSSAIEIGVAASIVCYFSITFLKHKLKYDDSLDVFGIHGAGGITGAILTGFYAEKALNADGVDGLLLGNTAQVYYQIIGVLAVVAFAAVLTYVILKVIEYVIGLRVPETDELMGLDLSQHEESAYTLLD